MESSRKQTARFEDRVIAELEAAPNIGWKGKIFSDWEDDLIKKYYPQKGSLQLSKALGKSVAQIIHRAQSLGIRRTRQT